MASTDTHGLCAGMPIVVKAVNAVNRLPAMRKLPDGQLGVHADAWPVKLLDHHEIPHEIVEKAQCCGMPGLELGDLRARAGPSSVPFRTAR